MLNDEIVLEINRNVLKRFEPNLNDGTVFLFDIKNENVWTGNAAVDCLLRLIDGNTRLAEIYKNLVEIFEGYTVEEVMSSYNSVIESLIEKGFLVIKDEA